MQSHATEEQLIEASRERRAKRLSGRERPVRFVESLAFLASAGALALFGQSDRPLSLPALGIVLVLFTLASRTDFEIATGCAVPTELVLVPALFLLPVVLVPLVMA